ncbi:hypothetical protein, partial [Thermoflexus sp.]|uniref:hypothetical protein n=1 Tax=Thermoflexus sp. TaxID=1969742 RepID=UPI00263082C9
MTYRDSFYFAVAFPDRIFSEYDTSYIPESYDLESEPIANALSETIESIRRKRTARALPRKASMLESAPAIRSKKPRARLQSNLSSSPHPQSDSSIAVDADHAAPLNPLALPTPEA